MGIPFKERTEMKRLKRLRVEDLSQLQCEWHMSHDEESRTDVLVVSFSGVFGTGSAGNGDASYMQAMTLSALAGYSCEAIVVDLQQLDYRWGDALLSVFQDIYQFKNDPGEPSFPAVVVTSESCRLALLSLCGVSEVDAAWHFRDREQAIAAAHQKAKEWLDA